MDAVKLLGALLGSNATGGNLLGSVIGSDDTRQPAARQPQSGAAELLKGLLGGSAGGAPQSGSGSVGGLLGDLLGGSSGSGGSSSNILGGLLKAAMAKQMAGMAGGGGQGSGTGLLDELLGGGQPEPEPPAPERQAANDQATLLIRAMCNAAKADGQVDRTEQQNIVSRLGELDQQEIDFLQQELSAPLDVTGFARSVPSGLEAQVYAMSVMTVKVDTRQEVRYLTELATELGLSQDTLDAIHRQVGAS